MRKFPFWINTAKGKNFIDSFSFLFRKYSSIFTHPLVALVLSMTTALLINLSEHKRVYSCSNLKLIKINKFSLNPREMIFFHRFDNCSIHPICFEVLLVQHSSVIALAM